MKTWDTQFKIEGEGRSYQAIASEYAEYIHKDYYVTLDEISHYLSCSYSFVQINIRPHVKHIVINTPARKMLLKCEEEGILDFEDHRHLIMKRILFSFEDTWRYIQSILTQEKLWEYIPLNRFKEHEYFYSELEAATRASVEQSGSFDEILLQRVREAAEGLFKRGEGETLPLSYLPDQLFSLQDLKSLFHFNHNVEVYRFLEQRKVNKILLQGLVRYDLHEINAPLIPIPLENYLREGEESIINELISSLYKK